MQRKILLSLHKLENLSLTWSWMKIEVHHSKSIIDSYSLFIYSLYVFQKRIINVLSSLIYFLIRKEEWPWYYLDLEYISRRYHWLLTSLNYAKYAINFTANYGIRTVYVISIQIYKNLSMSFCMKFVNHQANSNQMMQYSVFIHL